MQSNIKLSKHTFIDGDFSIEINVSEEEKIIYMSQAEMAVLFGISIGTISKFIKKIHEIQMGQFSENNQFRKTIFQNRTVFYSLEIIKEIGQKYNPERIEKLENWLDEICNANLPVSLGESFKIVRYNHNNFSIDVKIDLTNNTAWLPQDDIAVLLGVTTSNVSYHISNIYEENELDKMSTLEIFSIVRFEGNREVKRNVDHYNVDMIIAIGYRVKSKLAIEFRKWVSSIVKNYITKGYVIDENRFKLLENNNNLLIEKIDGLKEVVIDNTERIKTLEDWKNNNDIPREVIFDSGQYVEAYEYLIKIIESANSSVDIIDGYADHTLLTIIKHKKAGVVARVLTSNKSKLDSNLINNFNNEYGNLIVSYNSDFHDRYYIVDRTTGYHVGPSINHAGKKVAGSTKLNDNSIIQFLLTKIDGCFINQH